MTDLRVGHFLILERSDDTVQIKIPEINWGHGSDTRNIINEVIKTLNKLGYSYNEALAMAKKILSDAKKTNDMNKDVQKQIDDLIINAGVSDAEVVQARNSFPLLKDRLNAAEVPTQVDFVSDLQKLSSHDKNMNIEIVYGSSQMFNVNIRSTDKKGVAYQFLKNSNDDYIIQYGSFVGNIEEISAVIETGNYQKSTGSINNTNYPNNFTFEVGTTIEYEFYGTRIDYYSYVDDRGGIWEFELISGSSAGRTKKISVWNETSAYEYQTLFDNLEYGRHRVKGTFKGADPNHAPSYGDARGWIYVGGKRPQDTYRTFYVYDDTFRINKTHDVLYSASNKEFAFEVRPAGSTENFQYVPQHSGIGTAFKMKEAKLMADGKPIEFIGGTTTPNVETMQLIQKVHGVDPSQPNNPLMEITTYHTIKDGVLSISGSIKFLRNTEINNAYTMMFPYWVSYAKKILTSMGNTYEVIPADPKITEFIPEKDLNKSFLILNDSDTDDRMRTALAMTIDNFTQTMRVGEQGAAGDDTRIEHRTPIIGKIYLQQFKQITVPAGFEYKFDGRFTTAIIDEIKDLYL